MSAPWAVALVLSEAVGEDGFDEVDAGFDAVACTA